MQFEEVTVESTIEFEKLRNSVDFSRDKNNEEKSEITGCLNDVHAIDRPFVKHCPTCGVLVNARVDSGDCNELSHARIKKNKSNPFCSDCGIQFL